MATQLDDTPLLPVEVDAGLRDLLQKHPLPEGVQDADMNQDEVAKALSTTINTIAKWIKLTEHPMPVVQGGGPGKPYVLRLSHCWAWKCAKDAAENNRTAHNQAQISMLQAQYLNVDVNDDMARLTGKQQRELSDAAIRHAQAGQLRRQLVEVSELIPLMESVLEAMRDGMKSTPDRLERELSLKPEEVALVERVCDDVLNAVADAIERAELSELSSSELDYAPASRALI